MPFLKCYYIGKVKCRPQSIYTHLYHKSPNQHLTGNKAQKLHKLYPNYLYSFFLVFILIVFQPKFSLPGWSYCLVLSSNVCFQPIPEQVQSLQLYIVLTKIKTNQIIIFQSQVHLTNLIMPLGIIF